MLLPKPHTPGGPPVLIGGGSAAAYRRAARLGDGWFGHWTEASSPEAEMEALRSELQRYDRADDASFRLRVGITHFGDPDKLTDKLTTAKSLGIQESALIVPVRSKFLQADLRLWAEVPDVLFPARRLPPIHRSRNPGCDSVG